MNRRGHCPSPRAQSGHWEPSSDIADFGDYLAAIRSGCPIITQITTGGGTTTPGSPLEERLKPIEALRPDSTSLNAGKMKFGQQLFLNTTDIMETFTRGMKK